MTVEPDFYDHPVWLPGDRVRHPDFGEGFFDCTYSDWTANGGDAFVDFDDDAYRCVRLVDLTRLD